MPACTLNFFLKFISTVILDLKVLYLLLEQIGKRTFSLENEELTRVKNLHGIPWIPMENSPWNSMEISP